MRIRLRWTQLPITFLVSLPFFMSACAASPGSLSQGAIPAAHQSYWGAGSITKIKHVIIVVQENRSFDNIFDGFPGAESKTYGYENNGNEVTLKSINWNAPTIYHGIEWVFTAYDSGKMDGFNLVPFDKPPNLPSGKASYKFIKRSLVAPYWDMAKQYVLADQMFPDSWGGSFPGHLNLIAGTSLISSTQAEQVPSNTPWGCNAPPSTVTQLLNPQHQWSSTGPFPCFTQFTTMKDTLDAAGVSWKYYAPSIQEDFGGRVWSEFSAISNVYNGPDWTNNVINPETTILTDITSGKLPAVSWVVPKSHNSDHDVGDTGGPAWVSSVVNTLGQSSYWKSTAIVVVWDDWGGWYDDMPPPQLDWTGLGFRVPCIIISPYVQAHVSHTQYEFGSILKFVEQAFNLPTLGHDDERATSISDSFDFTQKARHFKPIPSQLKPAYFLHQAPSNHAPDDE
jgi:phospholipase C